MPDPKDVNMLYIHRSESPRPLWRIRIRKKGRAIYSKIFPDDLYDNSKELSFKATLDTRNVVAADLGIDLIKHYRDCKTKSYRYTQAVGKRNTTGVAGVQFAVMYGSRYYKATISLEKYREKVKCFNCEKLGMKEAFKRAVAQRKAWIKELEAKNQKTLRDKQ